MRKRLRPASSTGLTRDGVWMIENGKIAYPLKNFRFNQSTVKILAPGNVLAMSKPERVGSSEGGGGSWLICHLILSANQEDP